MTAKSKRAIQSLKGLPTTGMDKNCPHYQEKQRRAVDVLLRFIESVHAGGVAQAYRDAMNNTASLKRPNVESIGAGVG